jgi:hypothetical protein
MKVSLSTAICAAATGTDTETHPLACLEMACKARGPSQLARVSSQCGHMFVAHRHRDVCGRIGA